MKRNIWIYAEARTDLKYANDRTKGKVNQKAANQNRRIDKSEKLIGPRKKLRKLAKGQGLKTAQYYFLKIGDFGESSLVQCEPYESHVKNHFVSIREVLLSKVVYSGVLSSNQSHLESIKPHTRFIPPTCDVRNRGLPIDNLAISLAIWFCILLFRIKHGYVQ